MLTKCSANFAETVSLKNVASMLWMIRYTFKKWVDKVSAWVKVYMIKKNILSMNQLLPDYEAFSVFL